MKDFKYLLGYDVGSSSIKASLLEAGSGKTVGAAVSPEKELEMVSDQPGWAEQKPEIWWEHVIRATRKLLSEQTVPNEEIGAIGISYQMHGLVAVDKNHEVLRPSIIWCDSRAAEIGRQAFQDLGPEMCLTHFLNSPGNFTASKLKWVQDNEPHVYEKIHKIMLPGDYIAMKMTGRISTTVSGLSEGILWDYHEQTVANRLLEYYHISDEILPDYGSSFEVTGELTSSAAEGLGLQKGTRIAYRAGDQPNNAFSLNVLNPGEVAATAGTSGVIYGITDQPDYDKKSRVNTFVHVNSTDEQPRYGVLLCVNGTGILNSWLKHNMGVDRSLTYDQMNDLANEAPIGTDGLTILPFGNGAERILENKDLGAQVFGLNFNRHKIQHILRAAQEGIVYALNYGFQIMEMMDMQLDTVKAGHANMYLSPLFREAFVNTTGSVLELYNTDGAQGAARGAGIGSGLYKSDKEAFEGLNKIQVIEPDSQKRSRYLDTYQQWVEKLKSGLD